MKLRIVAILVLALVSLALLAQAPAAPPTANPAEKGWAAYKSGDLTVAMAEARTALKTAPTDPQVLELFGRCSLALAEPSSAVGALNMLCSKRGTLSDYALLAAACEMAARPTEAQQALLKAEAAKEPAAEGLYALAYRKGDAASRTALLKRIAAEYASTASGLAPEIALWEGKGDAKFRQMAPLPATGATISLKTLYELEWVVAKTSDGEDIWLMVDTAARETVLSKETAERMKLAVAPVSMPVSAYPQPKEVGVTLVDKLDLGGVVVANIPALVVPDPAGTLKFREGRAGLKGVLGMDLLRGLKVRIDRQKNELRLFPKDAPLASLLDGDPSAWKDSPAFPCHDQVLVKSALGTRTSALGLLATGCSLVLVPEATVAGTGLQPDSKNIVDLSPAGELQLDQVGSVSSLGSNAGHSSVGRTRKQVLGWLDQALPMVGKVRTVPKASDVGFGGGRFQINDIPIYPQAVGDPIPTTVVVGKKITDFFALAIDPIAGKVYFKQVLFAK